MNTSQSSTSRPPPAPKRVRAPAVAAPFAPVSAPKVAVPAPKVAVPAPTPAPKVAVPAPTPAPVVAAPAPAATSLPLQQKVDASEDSSDESGLSVDRDGRETRYHWEDHVLVPVKSFPSDWDPSGKYYARNGERLTDLESGDHSDDYDDSDGRKDELTYRFIRRKDGSVRQIPKPPQGWAPFDKYVNREGQPVHYEEDSVSQAGEEPSESDASIETRYSFRNGEFLPVTSYSGEWDPEVQYYTKDGTLIEDGDTSSDESSSVPKRRAAPVDAQLRIMQQLGGAPLGKQ